MFAVLRRKQWKCTGGIAVPIKFKEQQAGLVPALCWANIGLLILWKWEWKSSYKWTGGGKLFSCGFIGRICVSVNLEDSCFESYFLILIFDLLKICQIQCTLNIK